MNSGAVRTDQGDIRAYLQPIWRRKWIVLIVAVVAAAGAYAFSTTRPKTYQASTHVYIENADPTAALTPGAVGGGPPTPQQLQDLATLFTAQSVTNAVSRQMGMSVAAAGGVNISPEANSSFITVAATSHSPRLAARLANTYVRVFLDQQRRQIVQQVSQARVAAESQLSSLHRASNPNASAERQTLLGQIAQLESIELNPAPSAQQIDTALPPSSPASPKPVQDGLIGLAVGLIIGLLLAYGLEMFDNRILSSDTIHEVLAKPVLAVLPHVKDVAPAVAGAAVMPSGFVESMRMLRVQLDLVDGPSRTLDLERNGNSGEASGRVVVVTSGRPGEGKSTVARGLALAFAESGARVLLMDADLRKPSLERLLNTGSRTGLVQVLAGHATIADAVSRVSTPDQPDPLSNGNGNGKPASGTLDLLSHGTQVPDPVSLLASRRMHDFIASMRREYDVVVLDTAPVLAVGDAVPLLQEADVALLVVRFGQSTRSSTKATAELLGRLPNIDLAGVIINDLRRSGGSGYGYGEYGYGYGGYDAQPAEQTEANTPA